LKHFELPTFYFALAEALQGFTPSTTFNRNISRVVPEVDFPIPAS